MPRSLLIRDIHTLVLMDQENTVLRDAYLYIEDGEIRQVGAKPAKLPRADRTISGRHAVAVPGLVLLHISSWLAPLATVAWSVKPGAELTKKFTRIESQSSLRNELMRPDSGTPATS